MHSVHMIKSPYCYRSVCVLKQHEAIATKRQGGGGSGDNVRMYAYLVRGLCLSGTATHLAQPFLEVLVVHLHLGGRTIIWSSHDERSGRREPYWHMVHTHQTNHHAKLWVEKLGLRARLCRT